MADSRNFRIVLDLSRFFLDHRRVARVFVKDKLKTIEDLHKKIKDIFGLDLFYLSTGEHFLPVSEDIRVLGNDETVRVNPDESAKSKEPQVEPKSKSICSFVENKPHKRSLHVIDEDLEPSSSKKKKTKRRHRTPPQDSSSSEREIPVEITKPKKRKEKYRDEVKNLDLENKVSEIKKKLKEKINDYVQENPTTSTKPAEDINMLLPKLQKYVKNSANKPDMVHLSHRVHVDTPIRTYSKYLPPPRTTSDYLAEKKINIIKIDVVGNPKQAVETASTKNVQMEMSTVDLTTSNQSVETSLPESSVKIIDVDTSANQSVKTLDSVASVKTTPENYVKTIVSSLEKQEHDSKISINESSAMEIGEEETTFESTQTSITSNPIPKKTNLRKIISGVGCVLELLKDSRESDSGLSQETENSSQYVTKRKRIRKRKRPSKEAPKPEIPVLPVMPKPMFTEACPKMHLKFDNEDYDNESVSPEFSSHESGVSTGKSAEENGITPLSLRLVDEEQPPMEQKYIFSPTHIQNAVVMDKLEPRVGDVIAFKVLKLTENYVPKVSEFVVGRVEESSMEDKVLQFRIFNGLEELTPPAGKFSVDQETTDYSSRLREFAWTELIEPRLLFP